MSENIIFEEWLSVNTIWHFGLIDASTGRGMSAIKEKPFNFCSDWGQWIRKGWKLENDQKA